jgi:hypothetical protein
MPVKPTGSENEQDFIGRCMSEEKGSFPDNLQRYAVCKSKWDNAGFDEVEMEKIPIEIVGDNEEKILEYLPDVKPHEAEHDYLQRCVIVLYPEYTDEQKGYSLCADKYQRIITVSDKRRETLSKIMKGKISKDVTNTIHNKIKGISLLAGLEGACWEGYEAIGTKIVDGKEVPNCVPIKDK